MWSNKKSEVIYNKKLARRITLLGVAVGLVVAGIIYFHLRQAVASTPSPEVYLTDLSGNTRSLFAPGESALVTIRVYARNLASSTPAQLDVFEHLPTMDVGGTTKYILSFEGVDSTVDKTGHAYPNPTPVSVSGTPNYYKFSISGVSGVVDNYVDLKLKVKIGDTTGSFDAFSNYENCERGPLEVKSQDSKVQYVDSSTSTVVDTIVLNALCVKISKDSPYVIKTSYGSDPGNDPATTTATRKATFEAGEDVWVVLEIYEPEGSRTDFKIMDRVPGGVSGKIIGAEFRNSNGEVKKLNDIPISDGTVNFSHDSDGQLTLLKGNNSIIYQYKI